MGNMDGFDRTSGNEELPPPRPPPVTWSGWKIALAIVALAGVLIAVIALKGIP